MLIELRGQCRDQLLQLLLLLSQLGLLLFAYRLTHGPTYNVRPRHAGGKCRRSLPREPLPPQGPGPQGQCAHPHWPAHRFYFNPKKKLTTKCFLHTGRPACACTLAPRSVRHGTQGRKARPACLVRAGAALCCVQDRVRAQVVRHKMECEEESDKGYTVSWRQEWVHRAQGKPGQAPPATRTSYLEFEAPCRTT